MKANYLVTSTTEWGDIATAFSETYADALESAKDCVERGHGEVTVWERRASAVQVSAVEIITEGD